MKGSFRDLTALESEDDEVAYKMPEALAEPCRESDFASFTPLHQAALDGNVQELEALLRRGVGTEAREDMTRRTPLHIAVDAGHREVVQILLVERADKEATTTTGHTPLHLAVYKQRTGIVKLLIDEGANVAKPVGVYKYLPIHAAAMYGNLPIFKALCAAGANIRSRDGTGQTTFHYACHGENLEVMKYLLAELGVNVIRERETSYKRLAIHMAAQTGKLKALQLLAIVGSDLDGRDVAENIPLHLAVLEGHVKIAKLLLKLGCNRDAKNVFGKTAVHVAAERNKLDCLRLLLEAGGRADVEDAQGCTALDVARAQRHPDAIRVLAAACGDSRIMMHTWQPSAESVLYVSEDNLKTTSLAMHPEDPRPKSKPPPEHKMFALWCKLEAIKEKEAMRKRMGAAQGVSTVAQETSELYVNKIQARMKAEKSLELDQTLGHMSSLSVSAELSGTSAMSANPAYSRAMPHFAATASRPRSAMTLSNDPDFADWTSHPRYSAKKEERLLRRSTSTSRQLRYGGYYHVPGPGLAAKEKPPVQTKIYMRPRTAR